MNSKARLCVPGVRTSRGGVDAIYLVNYTPGRRFYHFTIT